MDMLFPLSVLFILFLGDSHAEKTTSLMSFTCSRPTTPCMNSATCPARSGHCQCTSGHMGLQCQVLASAMDLSALSCLDNDPCVEGQCYDRGDGQEAACICRPGYYGESCHLPMFDVDCQEDRMVLYLLPWGYDLNTWNLGHPYLVNTPAAILDTIASYSERHPDFVPSGRQGFVGEFLHVEDPAGSSAAVVFQNESAITFSRNVFVSYDWSGGHPTDQTLTATCTVPYVAPPIPSRIAPPTSPPGPQPVTTTLQPPPPVTFSPPDGEWTCLRPTTPCLGSGSSCNDVTGVCRCLPGTTGLQCTVPEDKINTGECTISTLNHCDPAGAICYDSGYGARCACVDGYYGERCQHPMVKTECSPERMTVNVFPYGYDANVWPSSLRPSLFPSSSCPMKTVAELMSTVPEVTSRKWEGFADVYLHVNDPCAGNADIASENATTRVFRRQIEVSYSTMGHHHTDMLLPVTCSVLLADLPVTTTTVTESTTHSTTTNPPQTMATNALPNITQKTVTTTTKTTITTPAAQTVITPQPVRPDDTGHMTLGDLGLGQTTPVPQGQTTVSSQGQTQLPSPWVSITLLDEFGNGIRGPVKLGNMVLAVFSLHPLKNNKDVTDLRVESCQVTDEMTGQNISVVRNSCAQGPMGMLLYSKKEGTRILIIKVMKFPTSVKLNFSCSIRLCTFHDSACSLIPSCSDRLTRSLHNMHSGHPAMMTVVETTLIGS